MKKLGKDVIDGRKNLPKGYVFIGWDKEKREKAKADGFPIFKMLVGYRWTPNAKWQPVFHGYVRGK
jgi:hypothetical protein